MNGALKDKDVFRVKVLRFLKSQLDAAAKDKLGDLTEEEVVKVIQKKIKQSQDALEKYNQGGRPELAEAERREIETVKSYLPAELSPKELGDIVERVLAGFGAVTKKDFGRVMGAVVKEVAGRADGRAIKELVEGKLS